MQNERDDDCVAFICYPLLRDSKQTRHTWLYVESVTIGARVGTKLRFAKSVSLHKLLFGCNPWPNLSYHRLPLSRASNIKSSTEPRISVACTDHPPIIAYSAVKVTPRGKSNILLSEISPAARYLPFTDTRPTDLHLTGARRGFVANPSAIVTVQRILYSLSSQGYGHGPVVKLLLVEAVVRCQTFFRGSHRWVL